MNSLGYFDGVNLMALNWWPEYTLCGVEHVSVRWWSLDCQCSETFKRYQWEFVIWFSARRNSQAIFL